MILRYSLEKDFAFDDIVQQIIRFSNIDSVTTHNLYIKHTNTVGICLAFIYKKANHNLSFTIKKVNYEVDGHIINEVEINDTLIKVLMEQEIEATYVSNFNLSSFKEVLDKMEKLTTNAISISQLLLYQ